MFDLLFRKLMRHIELTQQDRERIRACAWSFDRVPAHAELMHEGSDPARVNVVLDGWASRYRQLKDGRRQLVALVLPGDLCDPCAFLLNNAFHGVRTLTQGTLMRIPEQQMRALLNEHPALVRAFWLDMLINADVQREWIVSLGRRTAIERMAHLFCELQVRQRMAGRADQDGCEMPVTQADIGDALGLSAVHVNRTLQQLRALKLIKLKGKRLVVCDEGALRSLALFDPNYLHLQVSSPPGFER